MAINENMQDLTQEWLRMQRELLEQWSASMKEAADTEGAPLFEQVANTWQSAIEQTMAMQRQWIISLREEIASMNEVSADTAAQVSNAADQFIAWTEVQERFWKEWVNLLQQSVPGNTIDQGQKVAQAMFETMQKGAESLINVTLNVMGGKGANAR